jgi:hypothetical protein
MRKVIILSVFLSLYFFPCSVFADDDALGAAFQASDSAQSMPMVDYHASIPQENVDGIKTIEQIKGEISGQAEQTEEVAQPEKKGVKYYMNRFFNKNKDSKNTRAKSRVNSREAEKNKTKSKAGQTKSTSTSSAKARSRTAASRKTSSSAGSRIGESKSIQEQTQADSKASTYHHF